MISTFKLFILLLLKASSVLTQTSTEADTSSTPEDKRVYSDKRCLPGCFFKSNILQNSSFKLFPTNCSTVCAPFGLHIGFETDLNETQMTETLKNVKNFVGSLTIMRTKFKSCNFFEKLEYIDCYNKGSFRIIMNSEMTEVGMKNLNRISCVVEIANNANLERLNLPNVTPFFSKNANFSLLEVEFYGNSDNFCVTIEEMMHLSEKNTILDRYGRTTGKYCEVTDPTIYPTKTCDVRKTSLENLDTGCVNIGGDLIIEGKDEDYVQKLETVEIVYGRLQISGTNLTNTNFLGKLQKVMSIAKDRPTIQVDNNHALSNVSFPSLKKILSTVVNPVVLNNNSQELLNDPAYCNAISNRIARDEPQKVKFDGKICSKNEYVWKKELEIGNSGDIKLVVVPTSVAPSPFTPNPPNDNSSNNVFSVLVLVVFTVTVVS
ncbi:unnamed protein product [Caenorhabditis brenneri]